MRTYRVTWEIIIEAETPEEAARKAREYQTREGTSALFFTVKADGMEPVEVDLWEGE